MLILLDSNKMHSLDGNGLIKSACDKLSEYGIENFINWHDEISVLIDDVPYNVIVDYVAGGVRFVHPDCIECNE
jgi:hypothetical protein